MIYNGGKQLPLILNAAANASSVPQIHNAHARQIDAIRTPQNSLVFTDIGSGGRGSARCGDVGVRPSAMFVGPSVGLAVRF